MLNAEVVQLINEINRIARVTSYNNSSILSGFGNTKNDDPLVSTALASTTTGVVNGHLTGAAGGTYTFLDESNGDNHFTLGNGVATQTIHIGPSLDFDDGAGGVLATSSSIIANFDRLGVSVTLSGSKAAEGINPTTDGYRDGELDGLVLRVDPGTGGTFQVGPDNGAVHRIEANVNDMAASGAFLGLGGVSVSQQSAAQSAISTFDLAI